MFGCPYVWMLPVCLDTPQYVWMPLYVWTPPVYLDVWMPPVHTQHKACFVTLRQCPYAPIHLDAPCMFGCPSCLDTPICLDAPHMFEPPALCLGDVWMPPVHTQQIESMLCHTKGVSICPHTFGCPCMFRCPCMFGHHPYVWMPPLVFGHPLYVWMSPYVWMHPRYV